MDHPNYLADKGPDLARLGYSPLPLEPGKKYPSVHGWQHLHMSPDEVEAFATTGVYGVGLLLGHLVCLDLDCEDEDTVDELVAAIKKHIGDTPIRHGRGSRVALYFYSPEGMTKRSTPKYMCWEGKTHQIEVLGLGQQSVAYHIHPETGRPYHWEGGELLDRAITALPPITPAQVEKLFRFFETLARREQWEPVQEAATTNDLADFEDDELEIANSKSRLGWDIDTAREHLKPIPADDRDIWVRVGMGLYHEFDGSAEAFELWDEWSQSSDKYDDGPEGVTVDRWNSFDPRLDQDPVTARFIRNLAAAHTDNADLIDSVMGEAPPDESLEDADTQPEYAMDLFWADGEQGEWTRPHEVVQSLFARGEVSMMSAQPNTGKSVLALDIAMAVATGTQWRDLKVEHGAVLYLAAESPTSIRVRIMGMRQEGLIRGPATLAVLNERLDIKSPEGRKQLVKLMRQFRQANPSFNLTLLDTLRKAVPGVNENDNGAEGYAPIMGFLSDLAIKMNVHIMIIHHSTKSGEGFAGGGVVSAAVDTEVFLKRGEKDLDGCLVAEVRQQRSLSSGGKRFVFKLGTATLPPEFANNFGDPVTAPIVDRHLSDDEVSMMGIEVRDRDQRLEDDRMDAEIEALVRAMVGHYRATGETLMPRDALVEETNIRKDRLARVRKEAHRRGLIRAEGQGTGVRYHVIPEQIRGF